MVSRTQRTASVWLPLRETCEQIQTSVKVWAEKDKTATLSRKVCNSAIAGVSSNVRISGRRSRSSKSCNKSFKIQPLATEASVFVAEIQHSRALHPLLWQHGNAWGPTRWRCGDLTKEVRPAVFCYIILKKKREHNDGLKGRQLFRVCGSNIDTTARLMLCKRVKSQISSNVSLQKKKGRPGYTSHNAWNVTESWFFFFFLVMVSHSRSGVGKPLQTGPCGCRFLFQSVMPTLQ